MLKNISMPEFNRKIHWENIYQNKNMEEVSWFQSEPTTSLNFLERFRLPKEASIIDIGGGDSFFVDCLLNLGYKNISVLDISEKAIEKAKKRLGGKASMVKWIVADVASFKPSEKYDFWHDRATFHFLTTQSEIENYINTVREHLNSDAYLVIGTFSENGPAKCSGIEIKQYTEKSMLNLMKDFFEKIKCIAVDHKTPFNTVQNFIFCSFKKLNAH